MSKKNILGFTKKQMKNITKEQIVEEIKQKIIEDGTLTGSKISIDFSDGTTVVIQDTKEFR